MASPSAILLRWLPQVLRWSVLVALAAAGVVARQHPPGPGEPDRTSGPWARVASVLDAANDEVGGAAAGAPFGAHRDDRLDAPFAGELAGELAGECVDESDAAHIRSQDAPPTPAEDDTSRPSASDRSGRAAVEQSARELSSVRRAPSRAVERPFRVTVTVHRVGAEWNAYFTRFVADSHLRLEVWSDDQFPWRSQDFAGSAPYVFVPRGTPLEATAAALAPYDRVVVEGVVRQVFAGEPWIELSAIEPADVSLTEATVFHAARAINLASRGLEDLACNELDHALAAPMPQRHRDELERLRAVYAAPAAER